MSEYDGLLGRTLRVWDDGDFEARKDNLTDVWSNIPEEEKRELIALLVAHAPESISEPTCQWRTERFK